MPKFLNTLGRSIVSIAICDRCKMKFSSEDLRPDENIPGLMVCDDCNDQKDPYRLPPLADDRIVPPFIRPDAPLSVPAAAVQQGPFRVTQDDEYRTTQDDDFRTVEADN